MKHVIRVFLVLATLMLSASGLGQSSQASRRPQFDDLLTRQVEINFPDSVTVTHAFAMVVTVTRMPGGIATVSGCGEEAKHMLVQGSTSLRGALDSIASLDPLSRWQVEGGVVNLLPIQAEPPLLNLRIPSFQTNKATTLFDALRQLLALEVVRKRMAELNVTEIKTEPGLADLKRTGSKNDKQELELSVQSKNVTLREALNAIVRAHGYAVWAYSERHCAGRNEVHIDFIAR